MEKSDYKEIKIIIILYAYLLLFSLGYIVSADKLLTK